MKDVPIRSIVHLFLVRGSIYLFPFITLPIITRSLGVTQFGVLSIFLALQQYFIMLVEYGFTLTGSRDIARVKIKSEEQKIISEVVACRLIIFLMSAILLYAIYLLSPIYKSSICYIIVVISVMSSVFNQTHFFIGKEKPGLS